MGLRGRFFSLFREVAIKALWWKNDLLSQVYELGVGMKSIGLYYNPVVSFAYLFNPDLEVDLL
jgi:hypothetical protein